MYGIHLDKSSSLSATRQLCQQLRLLIESGQLAAGTRLLPTRVLAKEWGIARNVVVEVYEQLTAEGYLDCRVGSGTYVAAGIRTHSGIQPDLPPTEAPVPQKEAVSGPEVIDFATGIPDLASFPGTIWAKYLREAAETLAVAESGYGDIRGFRTLRCAIRDFLFRAKGIRCTTEQILIVSGASEGIFLTALSLSPGFHSLYLEDPTISFARDIFRKMNYNLVPVEVDQQGMNLGLLSRFAPGHLVLLTPSHQFPSGSLLSIQRRQQAIRMAEEADSFILEDDYDSEFRLKGIPVPPMQTLSPSRVIYVGTFSKTLSPSLRIGFLIVPPHLMDRIAGTKEELNMYTPLVLQKALARFIVDGQLERHIHTMKKLYKKRRALLKERLFALFGNEISILGDDAGMHLQVCFRSDCYARLPWKNTDSYGFRLELASDYSIAETTEKPGGIILGYGNLTAGEIVEGVARIHTFVSESGLSSAQTPQ
ncbi:PLP-dependent aminotransferase family protein [Paenibacillus sp. 1P03SA]|uniref:MocR-like pyridoxine biosynthesis transcription factor PdxR n=1 Tax=Paenibacillus sp. 1P03SA TaxID=3132294 RepID=UPI00399F6017